MIWTSRRIGLRKLPILCHLAMILSSCCVKSTKSKVDFFLILKSCFLLNNVLDKLWNFL
jgi:hypothetical protein